MAGPIGKHARIMQGGADSRLRLALVSLLAWTAVGVVFAAPRFASTMPWWFVLRTTLAQWWAWGVLVPLIIALDRRLPIAADSLGTRLFVHILLGLPVTLLYSYVTALLQVLLGVLALSAALGPAPLHEALKGDFLWSLLVYLLVVGGWQAVQYSQHYLASQLRLERLERNFSEARLNALRMQLDPHFLFNALNTISSLVVSQPKQARGMIEQLGDLLRLSLESGRRQQVRLGEELEFLGHYLAIQKTRFGDSLQVVTDVPAAVREVMVPSLMLQPLVENAVRHGLSPRPGGGTVWVSAAVDNAMLCLTIEDDGVGLGEDWRDDRAGLGLGVTRERIAMLHGTQGADLQIGPRDGGGTCVRVTIPARAAETHGGD
ncbi:sensor histidine kinase [Dyella acidiphila]|uniref:histidine kinase n=1 Tax=Dyella acidiphila TaxID=2775866 RepID=A0ABR9G9S9_9GAMM|nr:sensor histidine kinase [Dyella acidiphila]MBE1160789.1 sensor histidine kinase [Dyella acidiphila]